VRERWFVEDVIFRIGDLILDRRRAPLIDLGLSIRFALDELAMRDNAKVDFPGGPDEISFTLMGDRVDVRSNFSAGAATCSYVDLVRAVAIFLRDTLDVVTEASPNLLRNRFIESLYRSSGVREKGREQFLRHSRIVSE